MLLDSVQSRLSW